MLGVAPDRRGVRRTMRAMKPRRSGIDQPCPTLALAALVAAALCLAGCGAGSNGRTTATTSPRSATGTGTPAPARGAPAAPARAGTGRPPHASRQCQRDATQALGAVAMRAYRQLVRGRDILATARALERSAMLGDRIAGADAGAIATAAATVAGGHYTRLQITRGSRTLAAQGSAATLAPIRGVLHDRHGRRVARFAISALPAVSFAQLAAHLTGSGVAVLPAAGGKPLAVVAAPGGEHPRSAFAFAADAFPAGRLRVVVSVPAAGRLCGRDRATTTLNAIGQVARGLYANEADSAVVRLSLRRVARNPALLAAVARDDAVATRAAVTALVYNHTHIVRLRVSHGGHLLADVGGPLVLAPARGVLVGAAGAPIGDFVLSLQDDLGYRLLMRRFTAANVLLRVGGVAVMGSIRGAHGPIPDSGTIRAGGVRYRLLSFDGERFPAGALRITVVMRQP